MVSSYEKGPGGIAEAKHSGQFANFRHFASSAKKCQNSAIYCRRPAGTNLQGLLAGSSRRILHPLHETHSVELSAMEAAMNSAG
jgi:hypothetical protein